MREKQLFEVFSPKSCEVAAVPTILKTAIILGEDLSKIEDIKCQLGKLYQMKDLGPASSYLGIQITRE